MANNSTSNGFYESEECPYLEDVAWRAEFLLTEDTYNHLLAIISINSISVLPTVLLNALVIFAVATREQLRNKSTILLACLAGADLLTGLVGQPIRIAAELQRILKKGTFCSALERVSMLSLIWHIKVSRDCHNTASNRRCDFSVGFYDICDNSRKHPCCSKQ